MKHYIASSQPKKTAPRTTARAGRETQGEEDKNGKQRHEVTKKVEAVKETDKRQTISELKTTRAGGREQPHETKQEPTNGREAVTAVSGSILSI